MVVGVRELIDTLWNVNKMPGQKDVAEERRINRYIMECKCIHAERLIKSFCELIDTLWNVNNHYLAELALPLTN